MQYVMIYWVQSDLYLVFDIFYEQSKGETWATRLNVTKLNTQIKSQHAPVSTEGDTENKVQSIEIMCHYIREQAHQLNKE